MKVSVDKNGTPRYFSAKLGWKEQFDPKEIEMLLAGAVPALIPPLAVQGRKNNVLQYDVTSYTTLEFYLTCILSREQFLELLDQLIALFRRMQSIYLNYKNLILDFNQAYVLLADRSVHMIYLPLRDSKREASISEFFRKLAQTVNRSTYELVMLVNEIVSFLDRPTPFSLNEFEQFLHKDRTIRGNTPAQNPKPGASQRYMDERPSDKSYDPLAKDSTVIPEYGGTVILGEQGGTVILGEDPWKVPPVLHHAFLVRTRTKARIEIKGSAFRVGKEAGRVDYCITDNPAISRVHTEILQHDGQYFVRDLKSTNKTYLNSCALTPGEENVLRSGDVLRLGNEEFTFSEEGID